MRKFTGGCFCGGVRYQVGGPALTICQCHCSMCQRAVGAPVVTWATFERGKLEATGPALAWFESSPGARRGFCNRCGTSLFFESDRYPGLIDVTVVTLADAASLAPTMHIYTKTRQPWMKLADGLPAHAGDSNSPPLAEG